MPMIINRRRKVYRDPADYWKALALNIFISGLLGAILPTRWILPACGFLWGYVVASPYGILDRVRNFYKRIRNIPCVHGEEDSK